MKKITPFIFCITILAMMSCTPEPLDIDVPQASTKTVMVSQYLYDSNSNQSIYTVTLTRTLSVTNDRAPIIDSNGIQVDSSLFIGGAIVTLQTLTGTYDFTELEAGIYTATGILFQTGEPCKIIAKDINGNTIVEASTVAMPAKTFNNIGVRSNKNQQLIEYVLDDDLNASNWYVVNYFSREKKDSLGMYTDPKFIAKQLTEQRLDVDLFTDSDFINGRLAISKNLPPTDFDTVGVAITEITKGYFDFLTVQKRYGKLINQLRGEALNFPTNVNGGIGYFNVTQPQLYILAIKR